MILDAKGFDKTGHKHMVFRTTCGHYVSLRIDLTGYISQVKPLEFQGQGGYQEECEKWHQDPNHIPTYVGSLDMLESAHRPQYLSELYAKGADSVSFNKDAPDDEGRSNGKTNNWNMRISGLFRHNGNGQHNGHPKGSGKKER